MNADEFDPYAVIRASIAKVAPDADLTTLSSKDSLADELGLDSMDTLNIVIDIHAKTGIDIPERDYGKLSTLEEFATYLLKAASADS